MNVIERMRSKFGGLEPKADDRSMSDELIPHVRTLLALVDFNETAEFNPKPDELAADGCRAEIEALRREIDRDNREIAHWTDLRDRHMAMLAAEEAKAKVLASFAERTIEAGKMPMAAE